MIKIKKRGQSANLVLLVGIILATTVSAFAVYTTFDDIVRDLVNGDPEIGAREFATNMEIVASSPNELTIYTSTPMTILGYPAYGTILLNAEDQKIRVHPYPQDLMKMQIQKSMHGEISAETAIGAYALYEFRSSGTAMKAKQKIYQEVSEKAAKEAKEAATKEGRERASSKASKYAAKAEKLGAKIEAGKVGGAGRKVARTVAKPITKTLQFLDKVTLKVASKTGKAAWKVVSAPFKAVGKVVSKVSRSIITKVIAWTGLRATREAAQADPTQITRAVRYVAWGAILVDWYFTIAPIEHSVRNARHATTEVDKKFGEHKFNTGNIPIHVAKPNCESRRYAIDSEVDLPFWMLGFIPGINEMIGSAMNMPMSEATEEIKAYNKITNDEDECYDAHNVYLNQDGSFFYRAMGATVGAIDGTGSTAVSDGLLGTASPILHPYTTLVIAPTVGCGVQAIADPDFGVSCLLTYDLLTIGAWSNNEFFGEGSYDSVEDSWSGNLWLTGIAGAVAAATQNPILLPVFYAVNNLAPMDSSTLFSYITGSPSLIDSQKEYYMEDAVLISISKEYDEQGNPILVVDKEI